MASSGHGKSTVSERLKDWCKNMLCYCSLANKTGSEDPGNIPLPTPSSPHTQFDLPSSRKGSADSHTTSRKGSADSHMTSLKGSDDSHMTSRKGSADSHMTDQSPRRKSVTFIDQVLGESEEKEEPPSPQLSPRSPTARRGVLSTQSTVESQLGELPAELRSLEARMTALFGNAFFTTVDEEGNEEGDVVEGARGDEDWVHMELKLQLTEQQLRTKISEVEHMTEHLRLSLKQKLTNGFFPFEFELTQFDSLKRRKATYTSPAMYTHPGGYKFRIEVLPSGEGMSEGTHMCINVVSLKGDLDPILKFPVSFIVTIQILNTYMDSGHFTREIDCNYVEPNGTREIGSEFEFILLKKLYWNEERGTLYLKNEKIRFRVTRILFINST